MSNSNNFTTAALVQEAGQQVIDRVTAERDEALRRIDTLEATNKIQVGLVDRFRQQHRDLLDIHTKAISVVRAALQEWVFENETVSIEDANEVLDAIGADKLLRKYEVTARLQGNVLGEWTVEAEDDSDALDAVKDNVSLITTASEEIPVEIVFDGDSVSADTYQCDVSVDFSDLLSDLADDIEWSVGEA